MELAASRNAISPEDFQVDDRTILQKLESLSKDLDIADFGVDFGDVFVSESQLQSPTKRAHAVDQLVSPPNNDTQQMKQTLFQTPEKSNTNPNIQNRKKRRKIDTTKDGVANSSQSSQIIDHGMYYTNNLYATQPGV